MKKIKSLAFAFIKTEWMIPAGLMILSAAPIIAGGVRLFQLGHGSVTLENARFFADPWPVVIHIVSVSLYSLLGALQFAPGFRQHQPSWHRIAGRILVPLGLLVAFSGLWMTQFYPSVQHDGLAVYVMRLIVGLAMTLFIGLGIETIRKRKFQEHGAWMIRAYALALGAGTQVFTHLPWFLFPSIQGEVARALSMGFGWAINIAVAEWIIRRPLKPSSQVAEVESSLFRAL